MTPEIIQKVHNVIVQEKKTVYAVDGDQFSFSSEKGEDSVIDK